MKDKKSDDFKIGIFDWFRIREDIWLVMVCVLAVMLVIFVLVNAIKMIWAGVIIFVLGTVFLIIIILIPLVIFANYVLKQISLYELRKYTNVGKHEVAIILGNDSWQIWQCIFISSYQGLRFLTEALKNQGKSFKVYITPSKKEFDEIVKNKDINILYLIGHGFKSRFALNKNEDSLEYSKYKDYKGEKKEEIHLYHCTPSKENPKSIIDYLVKKDNHSKCFIANKKIRVADYVYEFYKLYKQTLKERK